MKKPTALLVTTVHWPATTRLALALANAGFTVAAVAPSTHTLAQLPALSKYYVCRQYGLTQRSLVRDVARAIVELAPTIIIPCNDAAIACVHALYASTRSSARASRVAAVIRKSLGEPLSYQVTASKANFMRFAAAAGITVPVTEVVDDPSQLRRHPIGPLPQVIKRDGTSGGGGVWIVRTDEAWNEVVGRLAAAPSWLRLGKRIVRTGTLSPLRERTSAPPILLQEYIAGEQVNCAVAAWNGEMLGCNSARVVHTLGETGPATVIWIGRHRGIEAVAAHIVKQLGFSGFCGFDFILREDNAQLVLIEMNPRPTQTCHLALEPGYGLAEAMFDAVIGRERPVDVPTTPERLVALFPQEFWRDPKSPYLQEPYYDVPHDLPHLIAAYRLPPPTDWVERLKRLKAPILWPRDAATDLMIPLPQARRE